MNKLSIISVSMIKHFSQWIKQKRKLHNEQSAGPFVNERELWWIAFGENVGSEIGGKSQYFSRPGLILKKLAHGFFLVAPSTTKKREGTWYVPVKLEGKEMYICLHQIRTVDYRRLYTLMGQVDGDDFGRVKDGFRKVYL